MARFRTKTISRRTVEALKVEKDTVFWDRELTGFGVRVYPSGRKVYIAQARAKGKAAQRVTVAPHGVISPEEARRRAALMVSRIKAGEEPVPEPLSATLAKGPTVADIARRYLEDHVAVRCRPRTAEFYRTAVEKYLVPRLGKLSALAVDHARVTELHHALRDKPVMANKVVETLSRIYNAAEDRGLIPEASNPCGLVVKNRERKRERFLTPDEFQRLGRALGEVTGCRRVSPYSVAAIRLLILTGCRKREILHLRWEQVDLEAAELRLPDTKTGPRRVALSPRAVRVLEGIPRLPDSPWVIPGMVAGRPMRNIDEAWGVVCELAGIEDARIHDCRHSFASRALALGENLPMIGRLLGHSEEQTTERYAHLDRDWVREGAIRISESLAADVLTGYPGRPGTAPADVRGGAVDSGAARSVLAFPAQFRGRPTRAA